MPQTIEGSDIAYQMLKPISRAPYLQDKLLDQNIKAHYYGNPAILKEVKNVFPHPEFLHISSLLADYIYKTDQEKVFVFTSAQRIHILIANKGGLRFYNSFKFSAPEDFLYWIMLVLDSHNLDPKVIPVILGGRIGRNGPIIDLLSNYLGDVSFAELYNWHLPDGIEGHMYIDLYLAQLCG